ncbi:hypothetical protein BH24ACT15_BH24ACT15_26430 [soil metagenome]
MERTRIDRRHLGVVRARRQARREAPHLAPASTLAPSPGGSPNVRDLIVRIDEALATGTDPR